MVSDLIVLLKSSSKLSIECMQNESLKTENGTYRKRLNMQPNRPKGHHHSRWDAVAELARVIVGLVWGN
ncbi:hypothetical protein T07_5202 [Trichinella nelsoni]|uniref:Uncharacterized protein n=1 Tax=Trichinella nelsoni TaxID=6336 RepID=A0A0V0S277_9BILA|nr:hypothetical protein T07_5202 [Trichinella nelsoni]